MTGRSTWKRLYDIADARRQHLGISKKRMDENGGPSTSWFWDLQHRSGPPTTKMAESLEALDRKLGWPEGTSWRLARDPFVDGSKTALDEEDRLIAGDETTRVPAELDAREQRIRDFTGVVMGTLRGMDEVSAERTMREIIRLLGLG